MSNIAPRENHLPASLQAREGWDDEIDVEDSWDDIFDNPSSAMQGDMRSTQCREPQVASSSMDDSAFVPPTQPMPPSPAPSTPAGLGGRGYDPADVMEVTPTGERSADEGAAQAASELSPFDSFAGPVEFANSTTPPVCFVEHCDFARLRHSKFCKRHLQICQKMKMQASREAHYKQELFWCSLQVPSNCRQMFDDFDRSGWFLP